MLSGDSFATLTVSKEIEPDDVETIEAFFALAKRSLEKHAKARAAAIPPNPSPEAPKDASEAT